MQKVVPSLRRPPTLVRPLLLLAIVLSVAGGAIRLLNLDSSLSGFHPTRQYRSALIARACYYDRTPSVSPAARAVAAANRAMQPAGEPPIMEWLACQGYALAGREMLALPRALAAGVWVLGGVALFAVARRLTPDAAALVALSVYLFLPYSIVASRTFMPDPLMTAAAVWATLALIRMLEWPSHMRTAAAAVAIAVATLVKPMSIFFTVPAALGLALIRRDEPATARRLVLTVALGLGPALTYYGYEAIYGTLARDQMRLRFVPSLLGSTFFWNGLWTQVRRVFGTAFFAAGIAGTMLAAMPGRRLLAALWTGYVAFAIAFTYHMPTHDYYHLPFVALVAWACCVPSSVWRNDTVAVLAALAIAIGGCAAAWPRITDESGAARIADLEEIGRIAGHTTRAIFLDVDYGYPVMYHGEVSGDAWPTSDDLAAEAIGGAPPLRAADRLARDYGYGATHFIVTDLSSLDAQPDLRALLADRAIPLRKTAAYHVYRLDSEAALLLSSIAFQ